ncbi:extensin [Altererythrobacter aerius]|uniref:Extensin n=1 Tax=Tsuneonella aeria TaxID=1837929 RepID=A0A6I4T9V1_9SPHN|nr:extensin family protein [Tsuneonella aeria]MXO73982.1 extensin [Tsuneonella aeria]
MKFSWFDSLAIAALMLGAVLLGAKAWLDAHPEHNPWAPLDLRDPLGWATARKLAALRTDGPACRAVLERSDVAFTALDPAGAGACARPDRIVGDDFPLAPGRPVTTCAVAAAFARWVESGVRPAAEETLGSPLDRIEHYGTYSCRRLYGRSSGAWSEHATGNAIDIAAFVTEDGQRVSVLRDWPGDGAKAAFLRRVRDHACESFGTVLSPKYNAAHADHLHLDQAARGFGRVCR